MLKISAQHCTKGYISATRASDPAFTQSRVDHAQLRRTADQPRRYRVRSRPRIPSADKSSIGPASLATLFPRRRGTPAEPPNGPSPPVDGELGGLLTLSVAKKHSFTFQSNQKKDFLRYRMCLEFSCSQNRFSPCCGQAFSHPPRPILYLVSITASGCLTGSGPWRLMAQVQSTS